MRLSPAAALAGLVLVPAAGLADVPRVAADIAPVHSLVAQVLGGLGEPDLIVQPGASPHGYAMRPSEAAALQDADLVVWVGEALEPWLEVPIHTLGSGETLELLSVPETTLLPYRESNHEEEGHEEDDHGHDEDHHHHDGTDPHAWLDPQNGRVWLAAIADALARLDPENAATYRANAQAGQARIDEAEAEAREILAPHLDAPFVVYHNAYQYLEHRFGLQRALTIAAGDAAPPGAAQVDRVARSVAEGNVACVFAEPQFSGGLVTAVTGGDEARVAVLDPLAGESEPGPDLYPNLIRGLAAVIAGC